MHKVEVLKFDAGTKKLLMAIALAVAVLLVVLGFIGDPDPTFRWAMAGTAALTLAISALAVYLPRLETSISDDELSLNLTPLRHYRIPISEIRDLRAVDVNAAAYGGIGLRFSGGATGLIMHSGKGVEFVHGDRRIVFSAQDPDKVIRELQS